MTQYGGFWYSTARRRAGSAAQRGAQSQLCEPVCAGNPDAGPIPIFVNRGSAG